MSKMIIVNKKWTKMKWKVFILRAGETAPEMYEKWFRNYAHLNKHLARKRYVAKGKYTVNGYEPCAYHEQFDPPRYICD